MSLESYVTGLMKEPSPKGMDRLVLSGLSQLEKMYFSQVEKKRAADMASAVSASVPVISVGNVTAGGTGKTWPSSSARSGKSLPSSAGGIKAVLKKKAAAYRMGNPSSYPSKWQGTSPT